MIPYRPIAAQKQLDLRSSALDGDFPSVLAWIKVRGALAAMGRPWRSADFPAPQEELGGDGQAALDAERVALEQLFIEIVAGSVGLAPRLAGVPCSTGPSCRLRSFRRVSAPLELCCKQRSRASKTSASTMFSSPSCYSWSVTMSDSTLTTRRGRPTKAACTCTPTSPVCAQACKSKDRSPPRALIMLLLPPCCCVPSHTPQRLRLPTCHMPCQAREHSTHLCATAFCSQQQPPLLLQAR